MSVRRLCYSSNQKWVKGWRVKYARYGVFEKWVKG